MIPTILEYLKGYSYRDSYFIPPHYYYNQIKDLVAQFEALHPTNFHTNYTFNRTRSDLIPSSKSMHTIFSTPRITEFAFLFPYQLFVSAIQNSQVLQFQPCEDSLVQVSDYSDGMKFVCVTEYTVSHQNKLAFSS